MKALIKLSLFVCLIYFNLQANKGNPLPRSNGTASNETLSNSTTSIDPNITTSIPLTATSPDNTSTSITPGSNSTTDANVTTSANVTDVTPTTVDANATSVTSDNSTGINDTTATSFTTVATTNASSETPTLTAAHNITENFTATDSTQTVTSFYSTGAITGTTDKASEKLCDARSGFDGWSFFGGILLVVGIVALIVIVYKFVEYRRAEQPYHNF